VKPIPSLGLAAGCIASTIPNPREDINAPKFSRIRGSGIVLDMLSCKEVLLRIAEERFDAMVRIEGEEPKKLGYRLRQFLLETSNKG